jgi:hypothetical protein
VVVCDGSTTKRMAESYSTKIALNTNNLFLMSLIANIELSDIVSERAEIDSAMKIVSSRINILQANLKRSNIVVGEETFNNIKEVILKTNMDHSLLHAVQSEFQADSTLAWAINNHKADILLSCDSDLAALLGHRCVSIKIFTCQGRYINKILKYIDFLVPITLLYRYC